MATLEELEQRVPLLELSSRSEKEKDVSQQTLELVKRIAERVNAHDVLLNQHSVTLALLQQDVTALRNGQVELRRDMNARFDLVLEAIRNLGPREDRT